MRGWRPLPRLDSPSETSDSADSITEGKSASFLELFFDLVFVLAVTQVVSLIHDDPTLGGLGKGVVLLLLLWWTWSQYTWTTNFTGTDDFAIRISMLGAMAALLVMAGAVPDAFGDGGPWFGVTYFAVHILAGAIFWFGSREHETERHALVVYLPLAVSGAALILIGGLLDGNARLVMWLAAVLVHLLSAWRAGAGTWDVDPGHFAERNGLFVIIALGESIVAIGLTAAGVERSIETVAALIIAFAGASALWWSYFDRKSKAAEEYLRSLTGQPRGRFARDAYTLLHAPVVIGVVLYAVAAEEVVAHPAEPLAAEFRIALVLGTSLIMLAMVAATYRATKSIPVERMAVTVVLIGLAFASESIRADILNLIVTGVISFALYLERKHELPKPAGEQTLATARGEVQA